MTEPICRPSQAGDVPRLIELWKVCFGDEESYIRHYFDTYYRPQRGMVLEVGGDVASMLLTFPFILTEADGEQHPVSYVYAFCTHPDHQSHGYGRKLLRYAEECARREGCIGLVMVPGERPLFDFYGSLGYEVGGSITEVEMTGKKASYLPIEELTAEEYHRLREEKLADIPHISYDMETLRYQLSLCKLSEGGFYRIGASIAAVEPDEDMIYLKEVLSDSGNNAVSALMWHFCVEKALFRCPVSPDSSKRPFAVVKWLDGVSRDRSESWLAFAFD